MTASLFHVLRLQVGLLLGLLCIVPAPALAQQAASVRSARKAMRASVPPIAVLEDSVARLELIGLKRWTLAMIQDSLAVYAPHDSLLSHSCAAILRGKLHFADASVTYASWGDHRKPTWYLAVIEPQDSALVRYRAPYRDTLPLRAEWAPIRAVYDSDAGAFQYLLQRPRFMYSDSLVQVADLGLSEAGLERVRAMHGALAHLRSREAVRTARRTIQRDGSAKNRMAAVVLLGQAAAAGDADAWRSLIGVLRDPDPVAWTTADMVLSSAVKRGGVPTVDWKPAIPELRALLDGTNLFGYDRVLEVLSATRISPTLAAPLLRNGGQLIVARLASSQPGVSSEAHAFLVQIAGRDLGNDPLAWQRWIDAL